jgi:hypothetical protein
MQQFIEKYRDQITGVLSGFDRLVLRGSLRRLNYGWWDEKLGAGVPGPEGAPAVRRGWSSISGRARFCSRTTSSM